ncbi:HAD-like protein [Suhomyces tanzawaensis NRRL Y-17324]|uniref:HAD-like protein n=1 Tax=Suhomyces tanzawaensis NRRL Y-17324 TaxID=984487 RepID=A0A1E4SK84_9ASCO|nr:HAD-like protein [Suhomyces tanzawaensis NRRL Y-17324]ODV79847.1 HAD-like protein [Suhomyces tanzawaensis NRRL Y-17324]
MFRPRLVVADWDETITLEDTIRLVADTAYAAKPRFQPPFSHFSQTYLDAYDAHNQQFLRLHGKRDSLEKELEYQHGMRAVEMSSIAEIERLGLFKGLKSAQFRLQAQHVQIRPGVEQFLSRCRDQSIPVVILSINWTKAIIAECLKRLGFEENDLLRIIVNEFEYTHEVIDGVATELTSGKWSLETNVRTAIDKLEFVKLLKKKHSDVLYIGDSGTDLLGMLESDKAVVMDRGSALKSLDLLGIKRLAEASTLLKPQFEAH